MEEKTIDIWRRYKIKVYKTFNPIPATIYVQVSNADLEMFCDRIGEALNGNAVTFVNEKGKAKVYDRNTIVKIIIEEVPMKN